MEVYLRCRVLLYCWMRTVKRTRRAHVQCIECADCEPNDGSNCEPKRQSNVAYTQSN